MDFEDFDGGGDDDDDEIRDYYQCPFCSEDFDYVGLCCHIDEDHPTEAKSGVCSMYYEQRIWFCYYLVYTCWLIYFYNSYVWDLCFSIYRIPLDYLLFFKINKNI